MALPIVQKKYYTTKLFSSGKEIKFRPFTLGEQKVIILAKSEGKTETEVFKIAIDMLSGCVDGCDIYQIPLVDFQRLFYDIRTVSEGNLIKWKMTCKNDDCKKESEQEVDIKRDITIANKENFLLEYKIPDTVIALRFKQPSVEDVIKVQGLEISQEEKAFVLMPLCMYEVLEGEEVQRAGTDYDLKSASEFLESLDGETINAVSNFFKDSPAMEIIRPFECPHCKTPNQISREQVASFFS
jgi:hypothetical protein